MTKAQKKQAEDLLKLLEQGHDGIRQMAEIRNYETVLDLLSQCQECAIKLGELIEATEGEDCIIIPVIEDYCERAYQIYEKIQQGESVSADQACKILRRLWIRMENIEKNNIPERKEVVFLPYKASMWDSLESVWKAADNDIDCDAYVIPIPYYDKNPDGSFGQMHYEGDQYPAYVPITDYEEYDLALHRPDKIFIHNPYDNCNFATSVSPQFYSKNLKQYTEELIYIPYFILEEIDPSNKEAVKGISDFCIAPGVLNADVVVVQSENMRQIYIDVLSEEVGENTRFYWEKKILGLGSPKIDKVLKSKAEDFEIPEEWMRLLTKPDGSRKKVILYNTSGKALLQHKEKMLRKMEYVFRIFQENVDDVVLLWRPHPLVRATIEAMHPQIWEEYKKIVEQYRAEGWGIYDDSAQLDRALTLCDAYYGDGSSLVQLCQKVGKPVMLQNVEVV